MCHERERDTNPAEIKSEPSSLSSEKKETFHFKSIIEFIVSITREDDGFCAKFHGVSVITAELSR